MDTPDVGISWLGLEGRKTMWVCNTKCCWRDCLQLLCFWRDEWRADTFRERDRIIPQAWTYICMFTETRDPHYTHTHTLKMVWDKQIKCLSCVTHLELISHGHTNTFTYITHWKHTTLLSHHKHTHLLNKTHLDIITYAHFWCPPCVESLFSWFTGFLMFIKEAHQVCIYLSKIQKTQSNCEILSILIKLILIK